MAACTPTSGVDGWNWLRASLRPSTVIGIAVIGVVWIGAAVRLSTEETNALQAAERTTGNIARNFEAHVVQSIAEVDCF